ncbi:MAG: hypothetical protein FWH17_01290 [Oscillospiraceae bacterium]|nr:hypothetical protein [Oscillospiraceae bacterium]
MKKLLAIVLVVVLALALSASAFASTTSVPLGRPYVNDDASQAIWSNPEQNAEGNDGYQTDIPWALFKAATSIVITFDGAKFISLAKGLHARLLLRGAKFISLQRGFTRSPFCAIIISERRLRGGLV